MKTFLRTMIPVVATVAFSHLPDTHAAGQIVGACLRILHQEGLFAGVLLALLFVAASLLDVYPRQVLRGPMLMVVIMLLLTAVSQFGIIPRMETYRQAAGGVIDLGRIAGKPAQRGAYLSLWLGM